MLILAKTTKNLLKITFLVFKEEIKRTDTINKTKKIKIKNAATIKTKIKTRDATMIKTTAKKERTSIEINIA